MLFAQQGVLFWAALPHLAELLADNPVAVRLVCRVHTQPVSCGSPDRDPTTVFRMPDHPAKLKLTDPYEDHCKYTMEALKRFAALSGW